MRNCWEVLRPGRSTASEWAQVLDVLQRCHRDIEQMIFVWQLDHGALFRGVSIDAGHQERSGFIYRYKDFDSANVLTRRTIG